MKNDGTPRSSTPLPRAGNGLTGILLVMLFAVSLALPASSTGGTAPQDVVLRSTLGNGLRVIIVRNTLAPVVTTVVNYLVGSREEVPEFPGMAHAQEHMMFRGSPGLSGDQLTHIMASLGGMVNAYTMRTVTQYILTVPSQDLDVALHIGAIQMQGVTDSQRLWCTERGTVEREVAEGASNPKYIADELVLSHMFEGTPYAHTPLGTIPSFEKMTGSMLKKFYDTWYAPNNAVLVIVGNVEPGEALRLVRRFFDPIPRKTLPPRRQVCPLAMEPETLHLKTDKSYGSVTVSFRMPGSDSPDYPASRILADVLSSQRGSLFSLVPQGKAFYAEFALNPFPCCGLGQAVVTFPKGGDASRLAGEVKEIIRKKRERGFSPDLVAAAKRVRLTKAELKKNSIQDLAMAWSRAVAVNNRPSPDEGIRALTHVTVDDVNRVARKYLDPDRAIVSIAAPESSGKPSVSEEPDDAGVGEGALLSGRAKTVILPDWAEKAVGRLTIPAFVAKPAVMVLPNGLRLVVQRVTAGNTVSLYGHIYNRPEAEVPEGKEGVDQVLHQLFSYGTTTLDRIAFQKALDDVGARESAGADFTLQTLAGQFEKGVALLADNELRPALPEEGFRTVRTQLAEAVAGKLRSPDHLTRHALRTALFPPGDPGLRRATVETVSSLTLNDVKGYYQKVFRPDLATIVVIGRITPEKARVVIEKYFGSWKAEGHKPDLRLPPVPESRHSVTFIPDAERVSDEVTLAETIGAPRSFPDFYALVLGNHILGSSTCATRLYTQLRDRAGLVYYVSSSLKIRKARSTFQVRFGCSPSNVEKVRAIVERNLVAMQTTPVSVAELERAKALLLREMSLFESSVDRIAAGLSFRAAYDPPLEDPIQAARRYITLTPEQVRDAFAKWIRPSDLAVVIKGPERERAGGVGAAGK